MTIETGQRIPETTLRVMTPDGPSKVSSRELLGSGRVVLFAVPGAFTPTCDAKHLPGFLEQAGALRARGVARIVCLSVNDVWVMAAWGKASEVGDHLVMAADGNGEFVSALGLARDFSAGGMGQRSQRFAMLIEDGVVRGLWVDGPGEFKLSSAEHVLGELG